MTSQHEPSDDFPTFDVYRTRVDLYQKLAACVVGAGLFGTGAWLSYFSGDPYNIIYILFIPVTLAFLCGLYFLMRQFFARTFEVRINATGLYIKQPDLLSWSWSAIESVSVEDKVITVKLRNTGGYDQGMWDRTEVHFATNSFDTDVQTITSKIQDGIAHFNN